jgi:hypothetical protein
VRVVMNMRIAKRDLRHDPTRASASPARPSLPSTGTVAQRIERS